MNQSFKLIAKTFQGLEGVLAAELESLGAQNVEILKRAVSFSGDDELMYKANYCCRTALYILKPIAEFSIYDQEDLYKKIYDIAWEKFISVDGSMIIDTNLYNSVFSHTRFASQRVKDAIVDRFNRKFSRRPTVEKINPDFKIDLHMSNNQCVLSLNSSGEALFKRNYRKATGKAPINEVLAAGLIQLSGWNKKDTFIDPMCGSGTIVIEAAMYASNMPAGFFRKSFSFMHWNDFDPNLWNKVKNECDSKLVECEAEIWGLDISEAAIDIAEENVRQAKLHMDIMLEVNAMQDHLPPHGPGVLITNPPYGERLQEEDIVSFYQSIGDTLKHNYWGYEAWIISSELTALKNIGLKPAQKIPLFNGPLECRFVKFEIFEGSMKENKANEDEFAEILTIDYENESILNEIPDDIE